MTDGRSYVDLDSLYISRKMTEQDRRGIIKIHPSATEV